MLLHEGCRFVHWATWQYCSLSYELDSASKKQTQAAEQDSWEKGAKGWSTTSTCNSCGRRWSHGSSVNGVDDNRQPTFNTTDSQQPTMLLHFRRNFALLLCCISAIFSQRTNFAPEVFSILDDANFAFRLLVLPVRCHFWTFTFYTIPWHTLYGTCTVTQNSPGADAPGTLYLSSWTTNLVISKGLVDYTSLKQSICRLRLFSRWFLNEFIDYASTSAWDKLFHLFTTFWEKKYNIVSVRQDFFTTFQLWPLVKLSAAMRKKDDHGVADSPFII